MLINMCFNKYFSKFFFILTQTMLIRDPSNGYNKKKYIYSSSEEFLRLIHNQNQHYADFFFLCKECLNDSDESRSITFMQSSVDLRLIISYSCVITGGVGRIVTPLQYLNCERFVILSGRLVFFASLRRLPQDAAAIFCRRFLHNSVRCDV